MKKIFYLAALVWIIFEIANVYFIMPMPGSQEMNSLDLAYFLYSWRWAIRGALALVLLLSIKKVYASSRWKWLPFVPMLVLAGIGYLTNFQMAAETIFYQPTHLQLSAVGQNSVDSSRIVIGVARKGEAKAYPIQFLGYHHQVRDSLGGGPIMVTYCTVCRTGRVFEPIVKGKTEEFRLVGMDHYNAMFEDKTTGSWWRQVSGEAVAGALKGELLPELPATQTSLSKWIDLYPHTLIMQPDPAFQESYDSMSVYENGRPTGRLTRRDTASWQAKSWVVGIKLDGANKAFDWNQLEKEQIIHDVVGTQPVLIVLAADKKSFAAFKRTEDQFFTIHNDTLSDGRDTFNLIGFSQNYSTSDLEKVNAYQEYWHSWQEFGDQ